MTKSSDVHEFLVSRRARITPEMAGLATGVGLRRVPGLRREEVAMLAGMSVDYYNRFERGNIAGASESVLEALSRALRLDEAERSHLFDLARAAGKGSVRSVRRKVRGVRPALQQLLDGMNGIPAFIHNGRMDILAMNDLARMIYQAEDRGGAHPMNFAEYLFLDPTAREHTNSWDDMAEDVVAFLRQEAGRDPHNRDLSDLIGKLATRSDAFRTMWAAHNVRFHRTGVKPFHHDAVGDFELSYEALDLPGDDGLTLIAYSAAPGSRSHDALALLASLSATARRVRTAEETAARPTI